MQYFDSREGNIYTYSYRKEANADNGTIKISFKILASASGGVQVKMYPFYSASGADFADAELVVCKNPTLTLTSGTQTSIYALNTDGNVPSILNDIVV